MDESNQATIKLFPFFPFFSFASCIIIKKMSCNLEEKEKEEKKFF